MSDYKNDTYGKALGFEQLTVDNTSGGVACTSSKYKNDPTNSGNKERYLSAMVAVMTLEGTAGTNDIRWTVDGTAPTTSVGHYMKAGESLVLKGFGNIVKFRAIRVGGSSGTLSCTYFLG